MNDANSTVLRCDALTRRYTDGGHNVEVLTGIDLELKRGARAAVVGASGSGKSTLLHLLGGLDRPSEGTVEICGEPMHSLGDAARGALRNRAIGFVYQFHHLLPEFTALENVAMPLLVRRTPPAEARDQAASLLQRVGLGERLKHKPGEMSGGERQRAAVARALITRPAILMADEPTGNLDSKSGERVYELMLELNAELGTALLVVTHDMSLARRMQTVWNLEDGRLQAGPVGAA